MTPGPHSASSDNFILTLHQTARILARRNVLQNDIAVRFAKEWDPSTDQYGNACNNEALN